MPDLLSCSLAYVGKDRIIAMAHLPWKVRGIGTEKRSESTEVQPTAPAGPEPDRQAHLDRLRAEIAAGTYRVSAESLAAKLVRRIRWW
jgi:hypothetical protein